MTDHNQELSAKPSKRISIAYSPDSDDAFMIWALKERLIYWEGFDFEFHKDDIHVLNQAALETRFDVTAISVAHYPMIAKDYLILPVGSSIGDNYGPAIITHAASGIRSVDDLRGRRIAVPGKTTSAYIAARTLFGDFEAVERYFMDIAPAVAAGEADAGILIHEEQLDPEKRSGVIKLGDLGSLWMQRFGSSLPLGANAIRRDLMHADRLALTQLLQKSIAYGLEHRVEAMSAALQESQARISTDGAELYISQYVNAETLALSDSMSASLVEFIKTSAAIMDRPIRAQRFQDVFAH